MIDLQQDEISALCREANNTPSCVGLITWMHTFSPAKMWIAGLHALQKPFLRLHTQYNRNIPWAEVDMDFMNLNQAAHGDREFGFIGSRVRLESYRISSTAMQQRQLSWVAPFSLAAAASRSVYSSRFILLPSHRQPWSDTCRQDRSECTRRESRS